MEPVPADIGQTIFELYQALILDNRIGKKQINKILLISIIYKSSLWFIEN